MIRLLIYANVRRAIITHLGCRVLLEGRVNSHLKSTHCSRRGVCPLGPRKHEFAHFEVLKFPEMTSAALSGKEKESEEISYKSVDLEAKSTKWRCIRVAAITIAIRGGVS